VKYVQLPDYESDRRAATLCFACVTRKIRFKNYREAAGAVPKAGVP
jgi:hypothetical protein